MTIKLHCFGESGHSYKVALALTLAKLDWQPVFVDFFNGENRTPDYLALNPMGEAPVMVDGDVTLTQSGVILDYLSEKTGLFGLHDPAIRRDVLKWVLWDNHKMSSNIGVLRFLKNFLPADKRPAETIAFLEGRQRVAFKILNTALQDQPWLVGDTITAADLSCCSYLYYPEDMGFDRKDWPHIDAWLTRISDLPDWAPPYDLMPRALKAA
ncbi:glutathione S-transferase family protein [Pseudaestuariivita rosea]|uniref:glutathione S-transferase family protein n=1 Tax=Pseudaestuariivita rosea TaxID=2763263 RepID=UPI001ABAE34C|nr:glutathione S-transferase [Pseudaestuariivita rosea]